MGTDARFNPTQYPNTHNLLAAGLSTIPRQNASSVAAVGLTNQSLRMVYFTPVKSFTSTQVRMYSGSTAAGATPTLCRVGLYSIAPNGDGALVASIANDTTLFASTITAYTRAWSAPVGITQGQRYALGSLVVTGAAAPTVPGFAFAAAAIAAELDQAPRLTAQITGQADLPASFLVSAISASVLSGMQYAVVLP